MLDQRYREQIEYNLGRSLTPEEVVEAKSLNDLSEPQLAVGRILVRQQLVLCIKYLKGIVEDLDQRTATEFMDAVLNYGEPASTWKPKH